MQTELPKGKILVTGSAGFIGSAIVWKLNTLGFDDIITCDRLGEDERWKNLVPLKFYDFIHADQLLESKAWKDIKLVIHMGACSSTTERDADYLLHNNYEYTKQCCKRALENQAKFIYASSAATYGDGEQGMSDKLEDLSILRPLNMYGYSKHMFDLYAKQSGILNDIIGIKFFNVFGPNENHKADMRSMAHKAFEQIGKHGSISLFKSEHPDYEDGEQKRDFVYVKDAVDMLVFLATHNKAQGLYNIGSGRASSWNELAKAIFAAREQKENIAYIDMPEQLKGKYQYFTQADISKLRDLGYEKEPTPLANSVHDYINNYLAPKKLLGD